MVFILSKGGVCIQWDEGSRGTGEEMGTVWMGWVCGENGRRTLRGFRSSA
jgi:hypothetical protein